MCILLLGIWNQSGRWFPHAYAASEIKANIVDAVTKRPLEGVLVVAFWQDEGWGIHMPSLVSDGGPSPDCSELVNVATATTGSDGSFVIPAWSGKSGHCRYLSPFTPHLILYKPGYAELELAHTYKDPFWFAPGLFDSDYLYGGDIMMQPLGPHYFGMDYDSHVESLVHYSQDLEGLLDQRVPSRCFWSEARPALLLLLQEKKRLANYMPAGLGWFDDGLRQSGKSGSERWTCGDQGAYLDQLDSETAGIKPEGTLPVFFKSVDDTIDNGPDLALLAKVQGSVNMPLSSTSDSSGELEYDVRVDPRDPLYLQAMVVFPLNANPDESPGLYTRGSGSIGAMHNVSCETFVSAKHRVAGSKPTTRAECNWIITLRPGQPGCWYLSEEYLRRPRSTRLKEVLRVYGPVKLSILTNLPKYRDDEWTLWEPKMPFEVAIKTASDGATSSTSVDCPLTW